MGSEIICISNAFAIETASGDLVTTATSKPFLLAKGLINSNVLRYSRRAKSERAFIPKLSASLVLQSDKFFIGIVIKVLTLLPPRYKISPVFLAPDVFYPLHLS